MKRNCALLIFFLAAAFAYGQQVVDVPKQNDNYIYRSEKVRAYEAQFFGCPECDFISKVPGVCPNHQLTLLRFGTYYCPSKYHYTSSKRGSCPEHKIALKEMEMKYKQPYPVPGDKKNGK
jgi:hypothetical protein